MPVRLTSRDRSESARISPRSVRTVGKPSGTEDARFADRLETSASRRPIWSMERRPNCGKACQVSGTVRPETRCSSSSLVVSSGPKVRYWELSVTPSSSVGSLHQ